MRLVAKCGNNDANVHSLGALVAVSAAARTAAGAAGLVATAGAAGSTAGLDAAATFEGASSTVFTDVACAADSGAAGAFSFS